MLRLLEERYGVEGQRLAIVGYADTVADGGKDTDQEWAKKRRVDIVIVSDYGMRAEPDGKIPAAGIRNP
jgi:flagellar motor protein MotB